MSDYFVHESAYVDQGARIGRGSKIWHFSHIFPNAVIGENCVIGQNVVISNKVAIGNFVKIQNNVSVYEGVILEDYVFCGPSMVFTNVLTPRSEFPRNSIADFSTTLVKRGSSIGANATIVCGVTLHEYAFVAAGAVVTSDVAAFTMVAGVPAKPMGFMSAYGDVLDFSESDTVVDSRGDTYRKLGEGEVERTLVKGEGEMGKG